MEVDVNRSKRTPWKKLTDTRWHYRSYAFVADITLIKVVGGESIWRCFVSSPDGEICRPVLGGFYVYSKLKLAKIETIRYAKFLVENGLIKVETVPHSDRIPTVG